ncbi:hypothetical protein [Chryseobacterium profundimaris]|uniref:Uncharacterized protein n=1 Tax=Chryseobacterium profundimaris TaxID=1387275 RepID=A0ABY1NLD8_9FLAO|nr:hypothetical protein [Chryseobacterium profundimaris]SMP10645.1 hypothetical protein SAMN06264346_102226 [Chryseobacterium profundimaris]
MEQNSQDLLDFRIKVDEAYLDLQSSHYAKEKAFINRCFHMDKHNLFDKVKLRLHLIDSLYSTQMSKRYYGIEELAEALVQYSDEELINNANQYKNNGKNEFLEKLFYEKYGYNSIGEKEKKAVSLISKYLYFLTSYQFPIYDSLVKIAYPKVIKEYNIKTGYTKITDANFVQALSKLNQLSEINNFEKLDNYLWYSQKLESNSFSLIFSKEEHLKKIKLG